MKKLSKYERETIVNFNEGESEASVYTFNADLKRRLAEFSRKYPLLCRLERTTPACAALQRRTPGSGKGLCKRAWVPAGSSHTGYCIRVNRKGLFCRQTM